VTGASPKTDQLRAAWWPVKPESGAVDMNDDRLVIRAQPDLAAAPIPRLDAVYRVQAAQLIGCFSSSRRACPARSCHQRAGWTRSATKTIHKTTSLATAWCGLDRAPGSPHHQRRGLPPYTQCRHPGRRLACRARSSADSLQRARCLLAGQRRAHVVIDHPQLEGKLRGAQPGLHRAGRRICQQLSQSWRPALTTSFDILAHAATTAPTASQLVRQPVSQSNWAPDIKDQRAAGYHPGPVACLDERPATPGTRKGPGPAFLLPPEWTVRNGPTWVSDLPATLDGVDLYSTPQR